LLAIVAALLVAAALVASGFRLRDSFGGLAVASAKALSRTQDQPASQRPIFRTEANYVRVDVFPTADGQPVLDLRQDEFEVLEDRVAQKIVQFERVQIRGSVPQETRREPNSVAEARAMVEQSRARVFVVFLDINHVDVSGSHNIRQPLVNALERLIGPDDLFAVMTPEMAAAQITFARKTTTIDGMLARYWAWGERDRLTTIDPVERKYEDCYPGAGPSLTCPDDDRGVARAMIDRRREKTTIDALQDLVRFLHSAREERKAVLVVSDGWRLFRPDHSLMRRLYCQVPGTPPVMIDPRTGKLTTKDTTGGPIPATMYECDRDRMNLAQIDNDQQFRRILDEANRANTSFYPIDPRGLPVFDEPIVPLGDPAGPPPPTLPLDVDAARLRARVVSLRTLAENTDGLAIVESNDLGKGFKRIVDDLSSYYLLGYYSTGKLDGRFHAIAVRVKRPGVQVRARRGYLAPTPAEVESAAAAAAALAAANADASAEASAAAAEAHAIDALIAPLNRPARELPVRLEVAAGWKPGNTAAVWAVGEIGTGEEWKAGGDADVTLLSAAGATLATAHARVEPGSRSFRTPLVGADPLAAGEYAVRVRARGASASAVAATETVRFALPPAPQAAGAVLIRRGPATGNKEVVTADLRFRRSEQIRVEVPAPGTGSVSARLLDRTGKALALPVAAAVRDEADGSRWQTAQLALAPLAAGDYVIELAGGAGEAGGAGGTGRAGGASGSGGSGAETKRTLVAFKVVP
jgi:VWFA-related protein